MVCPEPTKPEWSAPEGLIQENGTVIDLEQLCISALRHWKKESLYNARLWYRNKYPLKNEYPVNDQNLLQQFYEYRTTINSRSHNALCTEDSEKHLVEITLRTVLISEAESGALDALVARRLIVGQAAEYLMKHWATLNQKAFAPPTTSASLSKSPPVLRANSSLANYLVHVKTAHLRSGFDSCGRY